MNRRNTFAAVAAASALIAILAAAWFIARQDRFDKLVNSIISTPQSYDGEHVDKLVALGSEGVPAIGKALTRGEEFPLRFVLALEQIGDALLIQQRLAERVRGRAGAILRRRSKFRYSSHDPESKHAERHRCVRTASIDT